MIAEPSLESFKSLLGGRGTITLETPTDDGPARFRSMNTPGTTPPSRCSRPIAPSPICNASIRMNRLLEKVAEMQQLFPDEVLQHLEFIPLQRPRHLQRTAVVRYKDRTD